MQLYFAILSLVTFLVTIFALILAFQLYALLKTGAIGQTWRVVAAAAMLYGLGEMLRFAGVWDLMDSNVVECGSRVANFIFVVLLAWAFWVQRQAFYQPHLYRFAEEERDRGYPSRFERLPLSDDLGDEFSEFLDEEADLSARTAGR